MKMPTVYFCRSEPKFFKVGDVWCAVCDVDPELSARIADKTKLICDAHQAWNEANVGQETVEPEWKLPSDPISRTIRYKGRPSKYSKIRFGIVKALVLADGKPVPYPVLAQEAYGDGSGKPVNVDKEILEDAIYQLNQFLKKTGIPKTVQYEKETAFFGKGESDP